MDQQRASGRQWWALYLLCLGVLLVVIDGTIVAVALPTIVVDLAISATSLTWILNAYLLAFGGFLLLGGRLGDYYERRRLFLGGTGVFTMASLACAVAQTQAELFAARAAQGVGGAVVTAVSLSLIVNMFAAPTARARAMGIYGFVWAAGTGVGELLGGFLTNAMSWRWVFLINVPIGLVVCLLGVRLLPRDVPTLCRRRLDVAGAVLVTAAFTLLVYAFAYGNQAGWTSRWTLGILSVVALALLGFLTIEYRVRDPLMPLRLFRLRSFAAANVMALLWAAGAMPWFVNSALYLQRVLGYDPLQIGLALVPGTLIMAAAAVGLSKGIVTKFGLCGPLSIGLFTLTAGVALFARAPIGGTFVTDVLPGMLLQGLGAGIAYTPLLLLAMNEVDTKESGLASGMVNTSFVMGQALGLAVLSSVAEARMSAVQRSGTDALVALVDGYHLSFLISALLIAGAAIVGTLVLRLGSSAKTGDQECVLCPDEAIELKNSASSQ